MARFSSSNRIAARNMCAADTRQSGAPLAPGFLLSRKDLEIFTIRPVSG